MSQRGNGRYDRSRYGSGGDDRPSANRYHDSFFDDMLIPEEDDPHRSFSSRLGDNSDVSHESRFRAARDDEFEDGALSGEDASGDSEWGSAFGYSGRGRSSDDSGRGRSYDDLRRDRYSGDSGQGRSSDDSEWGSLSDDSGREGSSDDSEWGRSFGYSRRDSARRGAYTHVETEDPIDETIVEEDDSDRAVRAFSRKSVEEKVATSASQKRPRVKLGLIGRVVAVVAVAAILVGAGVAFAFFAGIADNLHAGVDDDLRNALVKTDMANEPFYMLLLGTDGSAERDEDPYYSGGYRSDSMMLARIDPVEKKATLVSIGRDIQVDLGPEYGEQKINAAYAFGGPAFAVKAVSQLAGVPISHYAQVDFDGFAAMVDALGGVEVDVPMAIVNDYDAGGSVPGGLQTLDGAQALILCRARNSYADISAHPDEIRAANQRLVLSAIARKLLNSDVATIASTVQAMSSYVTTDLELTDIIGLAQIMKGLDPDTSIYTASVPTSSQYINDIWYEMVDKKAWDEMMKRVKAGEPPVDEAIVDETTGSVLATAGAGTQNSAEKYAVVTVKNGTSTSGLAAKVRSELNDNGFVNAVVGDIAPGYSYPNTLVIYNDDNRAREAEEIAKVMGQGHAMKNDGSYLLMDTDFLVIIGDDWDTSR